MVSMKNRLKLLDWIGKQVEIVDARNKDYIGIKGRIIDETLNMIIISNGKEIKKILKKGTKFKIEGTIVEGIVARPWDVKKRWKI